MLIPSSNVHADIVTLAQSLVAENTRLKNYTKQSVLLNRLITKIKGTKEKKKAKFTS